MSNKFAILQIKVTPRSAKRLITEISADGIIRVRLTAPPVEGKANRELLKYLADELELPVSDLEIRAGESGRTKLVRVTGKDLAEILERLRSKIS